MAGGINIGGDDEPISNINITPFVDVVLVLLVIFIVTAKFITTQGVKVELPQAASTEQLQTQKTFNILIGKDGDIVLDGTRVTADELRARGRDAKAGGQKVVAMISADKGTVYNYVVGVMDALRQEGIADFALQLDPLPASKP